MRLERLVEADRGTGIGENHRWRDRRFIEN
jgi:hypothetical protein